MTRSRQRRVDPDRRARIIRSALDTIALHGVAGTTHRRIAAMADVPLGSLTYHFTSLEEILTAAFTLLAQRSADEFQQRLSLARSREDAEDAVTDIIAGNIWSHPTTLLLSYELYAFAARNDSMKHILRDWMAASRSAFSLYFDPLTARALDALVEGIGIHNSIDSTPLNRREIAEIVRRVTALGHMPAQDTARHASTGKSGERE